MPLHFAATALGGDRVVKVSVADSSFHDVLRARAHARMYVRACVRACVRTRVRACVCTRVRVKENDWWGCPIVSNHVPLHTYLC